MTERGLTPLIEACRLKNKELVQLLLQVPGITINLVDNTGQFLYTSREIESMLDQFKLRNNLKGMKRKSDGGNNPQELPETKMIKVPECPVCMERYYENDKIYQCASGHFLCQRCHLRIKDCPRCRTKIVGRSHDFEQILFSVLPN